MMNRLFFAMAIIVLFVLISAIYGIKNKRIPEAVILLIGGLLVGSAIYLWPASMWRSVANGFLVIAFICFLIFEIMLARKLEKK